MAPIRFAGDPVRAAAWLYYAENRTQNEVAQVLGVSRQTVANYLTDARKTGLVRIELAPDLLAEQTLATALRDRFALAGVHVAPTSTDPETLRAQVARAGAHVLLQLARDGDTIGVASGRTLSALAQAMPQVMMPRATVVQVAGSSHYAERHSPEVCASDLAARLSAQCLNLHAPAYVSRPDLALDLLAEPALVQHFARIDGAGVLVFGVGELTEETAMDHSPFLTDDVKAHYLAAGAEAVIFGRFLGADGAETGGPLTDRTIAVTVDAARAVPVRLAVAGGVQKKAAVSAAIAAGLVTHLVLDTSLAEALLEEGA